MNLKDNGFCFSVEGIPESLLTGLENDISRLALQAAVNDSESTDDIVSRLSSSDQELLYKLYLLLPKLESFSQLRDYFYSVTKKFISSEAPLFDVGSGILFSPPQDKRLSWSWHQERNYHPNISQILHFWIPLFRDASEENGAMSALAGTHKLGSLSFLKEKKFPNGGTSLVPTNIEELTREYEEVIFNIERQHYACFDKDLVHRSNFNSSPYPRYTCVIRIGVLDNFSTQGQLPI